VHEATKSMKMVLFIDGLDEFHGDCWEQVEFIEFIKSLLSSNIKICLSSRPWNVFRRRIQKCSKFETRRSTYPDIKLYLESKLMANGGFVVLQQLDYQSATQPIENITTKASSVFFWVFLVIRSLLEGLTNRERLSDLQIWLDSLPANLEALFWKIPNSSDIERASQLLQIVNAARTHLNVLQLSFVDEDDREYVFKIQATLLTDEQTVSRAELIRRRLNAYYRGPLEAQRSDHIPLAKTKVNFLHRTVKDFVQIPDIWEKFLGSTKFSFALLFVCVFLALPRSKQLPLMPTRTLAIYGIGIYLLSRM